MEEEFQEQEGTLGYRIATRYASFIVKWPSFNIGIVLILVILAGVLGFVKPVAQDLPNFSEPTKGFDAWGTTLSSRYNALAGLSALTGLFQEPPSGTVKQSRSRRASPLNFCDSSVKFYVESMVIVYEAASGSSNMFTLSNLKSVCRLHKRIVEGNSLYVNGRVTRIFNGQSVPCPTYSIPNIIAAKYSRSSCEDIIQDDLDQYSILLKYCAQFYRSGLLAKCSENSDCTGIPSNCSAFPERNQIYSIYHYLTDSEFVKNPSHLKLIQNVDLLSNPWDTFTINNIFKPIYEKQLTNLGKAKEGNVKVAAFNFYDLRFNIFNDLLLKEAAFISVALLLVMILIWIFSGSIFIALMTFVCVIFALILAYFLYGVVFRLSFFPFLNVTTLIFLVGIGADDAFVYAGIWVEAKRLMPYTGKASYPEYLTRWTSYALRHALVAMLVTSFTTAAAFYATVTTKIVAIKCFSIFAGTAILTNYFLMVTFFPAIVILYEKYFVSCMHVCMPFCCPPRTDHVKNVNGRINSGVDTEMEQEIQGPDSNGRQPTSPTGLVHQVLEKVDQFTTAVFERYLPTIITKGKYIWIVIFLGLLIMGIVAIFVEPKLNLPLTQDFQMFSSSSSLEQYTLNYKRQFAFTRSSSGFFLTCQFAFGLVAKDPRSAFNVDKKGTTELKSSFDITSVTSQKWLLDLCTALKTAPFIRSNYIVFCERYNILLNLLKSPCGSAQALNAPCCNLTQPASPKTYDYCLRSAVKNVTNAKGFFLFDSSGRTRGLVFDVPLKYEFRDSYSYNKDLFDVIEGWVKPRMESAPDGYKDGFWAMQMAFFDLQTALATGTQQSLGIAIAIAFLVVLVTTLNPLLSFYAILSITGVISVTVGTLVLAGWRLNILESIVFSVAAGLSIDFTLHYGVAYQSSPDKTDRVIRVKYALRHIGAAVTMGAITTFIAGLAMSPASILAYIQMSQFLMLVMTVSWFYATFFFLPLCAAIGPTGSFCQLNLARIWPSGKGGETVTEGNHVEMNMDEVEPRSSPMPIFKNDSNNAIKA